MESELIDALSVCLSVLFIWEQKFGEGASAFQALSPVKLLLAIQTI